MMRIPRIFTTAVVLFALVLASANAQTKTSGPPYKIGVLLPMTGSGASFGEDGSLGLKIALADLNARGGILGRPVVGIVKDDAGDASTAARDALQLIQEEKVDAIVGPGFSNTSAAVLPITSDAKIIQIASSYLNDEGDAAKFRFAFKVNASAASVGQQFPIYIKKLKLTKVAIINVDNLQGAGVADGVTAASKSLGLTLVDRETMASGATDITPQLDKLHKLAPQVLVLAMAYGPDYVTVLKGLKQIGWTDVIPMGTSAINFPVVIKSAPMDILDHSYGSGGYRNLTVQCQPPALKAYLKEASANGFNGGPIMKDITFGALEYDSVMLIASAANGSKSTASLAMKAYLESHPTAGLVGTYFYGAQRHDGLRADDFVFVKAALPNNGLADMAPGQSCK